MKFLLSILLGLICLLSYSQKPVLPKGLPNPKSTGYAEIGYYRADSGWLSGTRDTMWQPIQGNVPVGATVFWQNAYWGYDVTNSSWYKFGTSADLGDYIKKSDSSLYVTQTKLIDTLTRYLRTVDWRVRTYRVNVPYGIGVRAFGNSITFPGSAASPVDSAYIQRLVNKIGGTLTNLGNFGASTNYTMYQINRLNLLPKVRTQLATYMNGINDIRFRNSIQALNRQLHGARTFAINCLYDTIRLASTLTEVGTWSNAGLDTSLCFRSVGRQTSTIGDYASFNVPAGAEGFFVVFGSGSGSNFSDSVRITAGGIEIQTHKLSNQFDTTFCYVAVCGRVPYLNSGGIVPPFQVRVINASNKAMPIDYVGYFKPKNKQLPGLIFDISTVSDSARTTRWGVPAGLTNGWFDTVNATIANDVYENFIKFGHQINYVYSNDGFNPNTMTLNPSLPYPSTDGIHPLNVGHRLFFQAAERAINMVSYGNITDTLANYWRIGGNSLSTDTVVIGTTTNAPVRMVSNGVPVALFSSISSGRAYYNKIAQMQSHLNGQIEFTNGGTVHTRANAATTTAFTFAELSSPTSGPFMNWTLSNGTQLYMDQIGRLGLGRGTNPILYGLHVGRTVGWNRDSVSLQRTKGSLSLLAMDSSFGRMYRYPMDSLVTPGQLSAVTGSQDLSSVTQRGRQTNYGIQVWDSATTLTQRLAYYFGDSWTAGVAATVEGRRWVNRLSSLLGVNLINRGTTGATAQIYGGDSSFQAKAALFPTFVSKAATPFFFFAYGVNDIRLSDINYTPDLYSVAINVGIDSLFKRGWPIDCIHGITAGYFKNDNQSYVDARAAVYNDTLRAVCARRGINFIDVYSVMKPYGSVLLNTVAGDSLHMNDVGHDTMSRVIFRAVTAITPPVYNKSTAYTELYGLSKADAVSFPRQPETPSVYRTNNPYITGDNFGNGAIQLVFPGRTIIRIIDTAQGTVGTVYNVGMPKVTAGAFSTIMSRTGAVTNAQIPVGQTNGSYLGSTNLTYQSGSFMMGVAADQIVKNTTNVNFSGASSRAIVAAGRSLGSGHSDLLDSSGFIMYNGSAYVDVVNTLFHRPNSVSIGSAGGIGNGLQLEAYSGPMRFWVGSGAAAQYNEVLRINALKKFGFGDTTHLATYDFRPAGSTALTANNVLMVRTVAGDSIMKIDNNKVSTSYGLDKYGLNLRSTFDALTKVDKGYVDSIGSLQIVTSKGTGGDTTNNRIIVTGNNNPPTVSGPVGPSLNLFAQNGEARIAGINYNSGGNNSPVRITGSTLVMEAQQTGGGTLILRNNGNGTIRVEDNTDRRGIVYNGNYNATLTDSSLVPKRYVDSISLRPGGLDTSITATLVTTNATPTTIVTIPIQNGFAYGVTYRVLAKQTANAAEAAYFNEAVMVSNSGSGAAILDGGQTELFSPLQTNGMLTTDFNTVTSGNNILIQVTGVAATNITWKITMSFVKQ